MEPEIKSVDYSKALSPAERTKMRRKLSSRKFYEKASLSNKIKENSSNIGCKFNDETKVDTIETAAETVSENLTHKVTQTAAKISIETNENRDEVANIYMDAKKVINETYKITVKSKNPTDVKEKVNVKAEEEFTLKKERVLVKTAKVSIKSDEEVEEFTDKREEVTAEAVEVTDKKKFLDKTAKVSIKSDEEVKEFTDYLSVKDEKIFDKGEDVDFETASEDLFSIISNFNEDEEEFTDEKTEVTVQTVESTKKDEFLDQTAKVRIKSDEEVEEFTDERLEVTVETVEATEIEDNIVLETEELILEAEQVAEDVIECNVKAEEVSVQEDEIRIEEYTFAEGEEPTVQEDQISTEEKIIVEEVKIEDHEKFAFDPENFILRVSQQLRVLKLEIELLEHKAHILSNKIDLMNQYERSYEISELKVLEMTQISDASGKFTRMILDYVTNPSDLNEN